MSSKIIVRKETHEINILTRPAVPEKRFCVCCQREVRWLMPEEAMLLANASLREIFRLIESSEIHFVESAEGFLLVCAASLATKKSK
jgi:hypothetical protein